MKILGAALVLFCCIAASQGRSTRGDDDDIPPEPVPLSEEELTKLRRGLILKSPSDEEPPIPDHKHDPEEIPLPGQGASMQDAHNASGGKGWAVPGRGIPPPEDKQARIAKQDSTYVERTDDMIEPPATEPDETLADESVPRLEVEKELYDLVEKFRNRGLGMTSQKNSHLKEASATRGTSKIPYIDGVNIEYLAKYHPRKKLRTGQARHTHACNRVSAVPSSLRDPDVMFPDGIQNFYTKYVHAYKIPIIGSSNVTDEGLIRACYEVYFLLGPRYDLRNAYYKLYGRVAVIGDGEQQTSLPEYKSWNSEYWDTRARGLGATIGTPTTSVGDDNMRCASKKGGSDRYWDQDILAHEFGHSMHLMAASFVVKGFARRLGDTYSAAAEQGMWSGTYAGSNRNEYFATGMQFFMNAVSGFKVSPSSSDTKVSDRDSMAKYDPDLMKRLEETYSCDPSGWIERCDYTERVVPKVNSLCGRGADGTARCTNVPVGSRKICGYKTKTQDQCASMGCCWDGSSCYYPENDCEDQSMDCAEIGSWGWCDKNPAYMIINCPFACDTCSERKKALAKFSTDEINAMCQSKSRNCPAWRNQGLCKSHKNHMEKNCAWHCGWCTPEVNPFGL